MTEQEPEEADLEQELELLYRKVASTDDSEEIADSEPPFIPGNAVSETAAKENRTNACTADVKKERSFRFFPIVLGMVFFILVLALVAGFFWPAMYHYTVLHVENKTYPLRMNRVTGQASYFDGNHWLQPPLSSPVKVPVSANPAVQAAVVVPPDVNPVEILEGNPSSSPAPVKTQSKAGYTIQIKAFPDKEKKEAIAYAEAGRKMLSDDIRMETVEIQGRGTWHRIVFGHFASQEEASIAMKNRKLSLAYPGSFIQRKSGG